MPPQIDELIVLEEGRKWAGMLPGKAFDEQIRRRTVSIWAFKSKRRVLDCLGTGFVISKATGDSGKTYASVITCSHVLEFGISKLRPDLIRYLSGPFPKTVANLVGQLTREKSLFVALDVGDTKPDFRLCPVRHCVAFERSDLATITAEISSPPKTLPAFAINSDPVEVDTQVMTVGFPGMHPTEKDSKPVITGKTSLSRHVRNANAEVRLGRVAKVHQKMRHKPIFGYELDMPIPAGMSGGPVFAFNDSNFTPLDVIGVSMSDDNAGDPYDTTRAGSSYVIAAQNLYILPDISVADKTCQAGYVSDMALFGEFFTDRGTRDKELYLALTQDGPSLSRKVPIGLLK